MITDIFLSAIYAIVYALTYPIRIFEDVELTGSAFVTAVSYIVDAVSGLNNILPVDTAFYCFGIAIVVKNYNAMFKFFTWILRRLPTQS